MTTTDNEIILDVFELKNYKPVLKYRIVVYDKIIMSVNNSGIKNGVSKVINEAVKEEFEISELTKIEKLDYGNTLTHRFEIKKLGWKNLFLYLTDKELIKLGFKEKPKSFWENLVDFSLNGVWLWLGRIAVVTTLVTGIILIFQFLSNSCKPQVSIKSEEKIIHQPDSKIISKDTFNISKNDSLLNNLND